MSDRRTRRRNWTRTRLLDGLRGRNVPGSEHENQQAEVCQERYGRNKVSTSRREEWQYAPKVTRRAIKNGLLMMIIAVVVIGGGAGVEVVASAD